MMRPAANKLPETRTGRKAGYSLAAGAALLFLAGSVPGNPIARESAGTPHGYDPHYTAAGFFDIHVCNWPDRKLFFMPLFSTTRYSEITGIDVQYPDGHPLATLDLEKFRVIKPDGKPEKHVFITQTDVPDNAPDGWYRAIIRLADGSNVVARDYVVISSLPRASGMNPPDGAEQIRAPALLTWSAVGQGSYYQVFIRDDWDDNKLVYKSGLLHAPELAVPPGLLHSDGLYSWQVHARNTNEDPLYGDFNDGSMSGVATFSTSTN